MADRPRLSCRRPLLGVPCRRIDAAAAVSTSRRRAVARRAAVAAHPLVLGRRALCAAGPSRQQLPHGARGDAGAGAGAGGEHPPDRHRRHAGRGGGALRAGAAIVVRRRDARPGPPAVRRRAGRVRRARCARRRVRAPSERDRLKRAAALRAIEFVADGMTVGLGTGSTAYFVVEGLGRRVAEGLRIVGIPTSERTAAQARSLNIPLATFAEYQRIDLTIDGADEVERDSLNLIKGLGGALLREKIVAAASERLIIVVDHDKLVDRLGDHTPVPVEVTQFGWQATAARLAELGAEPVLRHAAEDHPFITDGGNYILDCRFGRIADAAALECRIAAIVGVVESGLFVGRSSAVVVASADGVEVLTRGAP